MGRDDVDAVIDVAAGLLSGGTRVATLDAAARHLAGLVHFDDLTVYVPAADWSTYSALHAVGR